MPALSDIPIFVINLAGSDARLDSARRQTAAAGLSFERIEACDGRSRKATDFPQYDPGAALTAFGSTLNSGEVGCYLSHIAAAQAVIASNAPMALVFEDDFKATDAAWETLSQATEFLREDAVPGWELVNLARAPKLIKTELATLSTGVHLMRAYYFPVIATALLWSRAGAQRFVAQASTPRAPVDHMYRRLMSESGNGLAFDRPPFTILGVESDIHLASVSGGGKSVQRPEFKWRAKTGEVRRQSRAIFHAVRNRLKG